MPHPGHRAGIDHFEFPFGQLSRLVAPGCYSLGPIALNLTGDARERPCQEESGPDAQLKGTVNVVLKKHIGTSASTPTYAVTLPSPLCPEFPIHVLAAFLATTPGRSRSFHIAFRTLSPREWACSFVMPSCSGCREPVE
jgi:hypothetical protein